LTDVLHWTCLQDLTVDLRDGTGEVGFLLGTVADDDDLIEELRVLMEDDV